MDLDDIGIDRMGRELLDIAESAEYIDLGLGFCVIIVKSIVVEVDSTIADVQMTGTYIENSSDISRDDSLVLDETVIEIVELMRGIRQ